jgi:CheY-like chemotaxis protein
VQAEDGRRALELLSKRRIALMITDLKMPVMDGFELLWSMLNQRLRVPTIVLTAFGTPEMHARVLASGALAYMDKPVDLDALVAKVKQLLAQQPIGHVEGVTLPGLLQLVELERKTCTLFVTTEGGKFGVLGFRDGRLVSAKYGARVGVDAAKLIVRWTAVSVDIDPRPPEVENIDEPLVGILMGSMVEADETLREAPSSRRTRPSWAPPTVVPPPGIVPPLPSLANTAQTTRPEPDASLGVRSQTTEKGSAPTTRTERNMANVGQSLENLLQIDGAFGAALVDWRSGLTLGASGGAGRLDMELAASANTQVVRAKMAAMDALGIKGSITDILITLDEQLHIIRPLKKYPDLFLYLAIDKAKGNLGLARAKTQQVETELAL